jgi:WD40 repeat protein
VIQNLSKDPRNRKFPRCPESVPNWHQFPKITQHAVESLGSYLKKKLKDFVSLTQILRQTNESLKFKNTLLGLKCENILISGSNEILLWDLDSGKCIKEIKGHDDSIDAFKILPNGLLVSVF